ncbi:MAG: transporter [Hyphomicrobiaceae bacterium]
MHASTHRFYRSRLALGVSASALLLTATASVADNRGGPRADDHAPAGVMLDHMHKAGEFMVGYRYGYSRQSGETLRGTRTATDDEIVDNGCGSHDCSMKQSGMRMHMHMLDIMYAPTDWLTLMVMPMWMSMSMDMAELSGGHGGGHGGHGGGHGGHGGHGGGAHGHGTEGFGDTILGVLVKITDGPGYTVHAGVMLSAPTGSVGEKDASGAFTHYMMQLGSGTWDFMPSVTYSGRDDRLSWGVQVSGVVRLEDDNESGYRLGDVFQATAWTSYRFVDWLSGSVRLIHTQQGQIEGHYNGAHNHSSPPDLQYNYGGLFWDVGVGINAVVPSGPLKGHRLGVEWLQPLSDDTNGYQQERDGTLWVNWSKAF